MENKEELAYKTKKPVGVFTFFKYQNKMVK